MKTDKPASSIIQLLEWAFSSFHYELLHPLSLSGKEVDLWRKKMEPVLPEGNPYGYDSIVYQADSEKTKVSLKI